MNICFVGGIHGVGKGSICKNVASKLDLIHLTASKVLKWEDISPKGNKNVKDFSFTQERLLTNLKAITIGGKRYLLDGHYCLLDEHNRPKRIEKNTFTSIEPKAFAVVVDDIRSVKTRLEERDCKSYDLEVLEQFQALEINYAKELAQDLSIPFFEVNNGNLIGFMDFLTGEVFR